MCLLSVCAYATDKLDDQRFLSAIAIVEDSVGKEGAHHELGPWQMGYTARRYSGGYGYPQALIWLRRMKAELKARGLPDNPYNLALVWNCDIAKVCAGQAPLCTYRYANRVTAIYGRRY